MSRLHISKDIRTVIVRMLYRANMNVILGKIHTDIRRYGNNCISRAGGSHKPYSCNRLSLGNSVISVFDANVTILMSLFDNIRWKSIWRSCRIYANNRIPNTLWYTYYSRLYQDAEHEYSVQFCSHANGTYCYIIS